MPARMFNRDKKIEEQVVCENTHLYILLYAHMHFVRHPVPFDRYFNGNN